MYKDFEFARLAQNRKDPGHSLSFLLLFFFFFSSQALTKQSKEEKSLYFWYVDLVLRAEAQNVM